MRLDSLSRLRGIGESDPLYSLVGIPMPRWNVRRIESADLPPRKLYFQPQQSTSPRNTPSRDAAARVPVDHEGITVHATASGAIQRVKALVIDRRCPKVPEGCPCCIHLSDLNLTWSGNNHLEDRR
jgi:hypothetical protein